MDLEYTIHAGEQMVARRVSRAEVEETIARWEVRYPDLKGNRCYVRRVGARSLRIVVNEQGRVPRVITVIVL